MEHPDGFLRAVERSQFFVNKILEDVPNTHKSCVSSEDLSLPSYNASLKYMESLLQIPRAPLLNGLSAEFTLEMCLKRISEGLQMYMDVLSILHKQVSNPEKMKAIETDVSDLLAQIKKMQEVSGFETGGEYGGSGLAPRLSGNLKVQVATHLCLQQLQDFAQHIHRSLRTMRPTQI